MWTGLLQFAPSQAQKVFDSWVVVFTSTGLLQFVPKQPQNALSPSSGRSGVGNLVILGVGGKPCTLGCGASGTAGGTRKTVPVDLWTFGC
jgi:hypothetical protein